MEWQSKQTSEEWGCGLRVATSPKAGPPVAILVGATRCEPPEQAYASAVVVRLACRAANKHWCVIHPFSEPHALAGS